MDAKERVSIARSRLLEWAPFFGHIALKFRIIVVGENTPQIPTAAVTPDAKLYINPAFIDSLTGPQLCGLLCHEVMHPALLCFERRGERSMRLWNIAHDYAINLIIQEMVQGYREPVAELPPGGLIDDKYKGLSAEEIYNKLLQEGGQDGLDRRQNGLNSSGGGESDLLGDLREDLADNKNPSDLEKKQQNDYWKMAVVEAAEVHSQKKGKGTLPAAIEKMVKDILEPRVDWPHVLGRWVGENGRRSDYSYQRPSRRSESAGAILPSMKKHGAADVVVLWDTSGSMGGREEEILSEVIGICNDLNMTLRVICCDYGICSDQSEVTEVGDIDIRGGGGSDFTPAFDMLREEGCDSVVVAFTDGMIGVPVEAPECLRGTLWVLNEGERPPTSSWGDVLTIGADGKVLLGGGAV
jgi:predicted metal-dependent peptidase